MISVKENYKRLFEAAKYSEILSNGAPSSSQELVYWIGAHVFTGREDQARYIFKQAKGFSSIQKIEAQFYLLLTSLRRSHYSDMQKDIWELFKLCSKNRSSIARFFLNQGLALLRYYKGEFLKSYEFAHKAFQESLVIERDYTCMIALDLMGHSQCMLESYSQGFEYFEEALRFSHKIQNNNNAEVIKLSVMTYKIESGRDLPFVEKTLEEWIEKIKVDDYFTKSNALILKAKILQLKGRFGVAEKLLNKIGNDIFTVNQGRQILNYNLTLGILRCVIDEPTRCLNLIQTSTKLCDRGQDNYFLHRFKELEYSIKNNRINEDQLKILSEVTGRNPKQKYPLAIVPEEYIKVTFKNEKSYPLKTETINNLDQNGLLGLICLAGFYNQREDFVDFTLSNRSCLFYLNQSIYKVDDLTAKQYELLQILVEKESWTRKEIFERYWQVEYDSFIHDNKIYVTLKRLRERLGEAHHLIKLDKGEIKIRRLKVFQVNQTKLKSSLDFSEGSSFIGSGLNPRQIQYLEHSISGEMLTPRNYAQRFSVSRNTVTRDLAELVRKGYLKKFGNQKGTFYCRD